MSSILEFLLTLTVAGSVLVALTVILPVEKSPTKWRYRLSKIALLLYLFPVAFSISWLNKRVFSSATTEQTVSQINSESIISGFTITTNVALIILGLWALGVIGYMAWQIYSYHKFVIKLKQTSATVSVSNELSKKLFIKKQELNVKRNVRLMQTTYIHSPILVGIWKPTIYVPRNLSLHADMVFHHELIHLKRKDLWVKALTLVISCLHWFNPFVHILRKHIHIWSELSCDDEVVKNMSFAERKRYGETILSVMAGANHVPTLFCASLSDDGKQLKRRLTTMLQAKKLSKKTLFLSITVLLVIVSISTTASVWTSSYTPNVVANVKNDLSIEVVSEQGDLPNTTEQELKETGNIVSEDFVQEQVAVSETNDLQPAQEQQPQVIEVIPTESFIDQNKEIIPIATEKVFEQTSEQVSEQLLDQVQLIETISMSAVIEPIPLASDLISE